MDIIRSFVGLEIFWLVGWTGGSGVRPARRERPITIPDARNTPTPQGTGISSLRPGLLTPTSSTTVYRTLEAEERRVGARLGRLSREGCRF